MILNFTSSSSLPLERVISLCTPSHIERKKNSISLFMCRISPKIPCKELQPYKNASRININLNTRVVKIWSNLYNPKKPDIIVKNLLEGKENE